MRYVASSISVSSMKVADLGIKTRFPFKGGARVREKSRGVFLSGNDPGEDRYTLLFRGSERNLNALLYQGVSPSALVSVCGHKGHGLQTVNNPYWSKESPADKAAGIRVRKAYFCKCPGLHRTTEADRPGRRVVSQILCKHQIAVKNRAKISGLAERRMPPTLPTE